VVSCIYITYKVKEYLSGVIVLLMFTVSVVKIIRNYTGISEYDGIHVLVSNKKNFLFKT